MIWGTWARVSGSNVETGSRIRCVCPGGGLWEGRVTQVEDRGRNGTRLHVHWDYGFGKRGLSDSYKRTASPGGKPGWSDFEVYVKTGLDVVFDILDDIEWCRRMRQPLGTFLHKDFRF